LLLAYYLATFLGSVPMACIGGLLLYVATGMVKPAEVRQVFEHNYFHVGLMIWTAVMVIATDFLIGVLSAIVLYAVLRKFLDRKPKIRQQSIPTDANEAGPARSEEN
jgi:MFS superfamily sulfate permease-like transporter